MSEKDFIWIECEDGYSVKSGQRKGYYWYIGDKEEVFIPEEIKGEKLTSYLRMFASYDLIGEDLQNPNLFKSVNERKKKIRKIIANSKYVLSAEEMFSHMEAEELDLSSMVLPNVENISRMFESVKARKIHTNGIDTSKVKDASEMFFLSEIEDIDLNFLTFNKVTRIEDIFATDMPIKETSLSNLNLSIKNLIYLSHELDFYSLKLNEPKLSI